MRSLRRMDGYGIRCDTARADHKDCEDHTDVTRTRTGAGDSFAAKPTREGRSRRRGARPDRDPGWQMLGQETRRRRNQSRELIPNCGRAQRR